jgi:excisionase family DNA binding protein
MSDDLLTTQQAAAELGVTDSRVRQLIIDGKLPAQRFGRSHMIRRKDLKGVVIGNRGRPRKESLTRKPNQSNAREDNPKG